MSDPDEDGEDGAEGEDVCGETYDHDERITHDDADGTQWECRRCGAEGWEPKEGKS